MKNAPAVDVSGMFEMLLSLALVVALIVGLSWLMKRMRGVQPVSSGEMRILGELVLGPREKVVLVRIGDAQALLGVGSNGVTALQVLEKPIQINEAAAAAGGFAQRLREVMQRSGMTK